jgi:FHA domain
MTAACPAGHPSTATDYCDQCGLPMSPTATVSIPSSSAPPPPAAAPAATQVCASCGNDAAQEALFCESCGYDFTTGAMPRQEQPASAPTVAPTVPPTPPAPGPSGVEWVVERWVDPGWYAVQDSADPCPSAGPPVIVALTETSVLIGRPSRSRAITPQVDCADDSGVSRRHAQLSTDGQRWWLEDLQSSNGTFVGPSSGPLPETPLVPGQRRELGPDDRIYVGTWTRLVVRRAEPSEQG